MSSPYDPRYQSQPDDPDERLTHPRYDPPPYQPSGYEGQRYRDMPYEAPPPYPQQQDQPYPYYEDQPYGHYPQQGGYGPYQGQPHPLEGYARADGGTAGVAPVTSLVTGLVGFFLSWIPVLGIAAWVLGPLAIVFGILGLKRGRAEHGIMSLMGLIAGAVSLIICFGYVLLFLLAVYR